MAIQIEVTVQPDYTCDGGGESRVTEIVILSHCQRNPYFVFDDCK